MSASPELIPIKNNPDDNREFVENPLCNETLQMTIDFYKKIGYNPPWICYYVKQNNDLVGSCGFKGKPVNGTIEIAYGTFEKYRKQGIATSICKLLVDLAQKTDPRVKITARTLPENSFSTRVLEANNFVFAGTVVDPEDGDVWEWIYEKNK